MSFGHNSPRLVLATALTALVVGALALGRPAAAQDDAPVYAGGSAAVIETKVDQLMNKAQKRLAAGRAQVGQRGAKATRNGARARSWTDFDQSLVEGSGLAARPGLLGAQGVTSTPTNYKANDKTADGAGAGQAEQSIAFLGNFGLCAWNDGQGFNTAGDVQGGAYTTNGGVTWTDYGSPPHLAGWPAQAWTSDPVVALNEKTGVFYYCGLLNPSSTTNGIGVISATFPAGVFTWGTPVVARSAANATDFIDKQWLVADSSNGNLYLTYTRFYAGGDEIQFQRSTDGGATWSAPLVLSDPGAAGYVQGSRPAVGPNGELYVVWYQVGLVSNQDDVMVRKSTDGGLTFGAEVSGAQFFNNFGTGAPGFNRNRSVLEPCPVVDRSTGTNRGRLYLTWQESVDWYNDPLGGGGSKTEVEINSNAGTATPFTPGQRLRGAFSSTSDVDWFSFPATQGTSYIFWVDSIPRPLYTIRIYCSNGTTSLAYSGDVSAPAGGNSFVVWTAPTTGTYYLRMFYTAGGTGTGGYRIQTGTNSVPTPGVERARDHRDVFVTYSDNGTTFSNPTRTNDDAAWFDNWLPEIAVGCDGYAYSMWYDFRDITTTCGGASHIYTTRSTDGSATWAANQIVTTAQTLWQSVATNISPNQGDYNGLYGGDAIGYSWTDGRLGDPDVYVARNRVGFTLPCGNDTTVLGGTSLALSYAVTNNNMMFGTSASYTLTADRNWPGVPASGSLPLAESATGNVPFSIAIPESAASGPVRLCFSVSEPNGACLHTCCITVNVINGATPALASLVSAMAEPGAVRVRWSVSVSSPVHVYRTTTGAAWDLVATRTADGDGRIEFTDTEVALGTRYGYRLGIADGGREVAAGETWVTVPAKAAFALHGGRPNPTTGPLSLSFSLADGSPATLELLDVNGRRVFESSVGNLGAGFHVVPVNGGQRLPIGIYMVRLTQHAQTLKSKVTVVR